MVFSFVSTPSRSARLFLPALACLLFSACGPTEPGPATSFPNPDPGFRPNILWIVAEDMSPTIPSFGDSTVVTPNLSRLAAEGVRYTHFFSAAAVCAPSRASITTGMYQGRIAAQHMRTGPWYSSELTDEQIAEYGQTNPSWPRGMSVYEALPPASVRMLSEEMRRAGYYATNAAKQDYQFRMPVTAWDLSEQGASWRTRRPGQPFYAVVNLFATHESQIWARALDPLAVPADLDVPVPPYLPDTEIGRQDIRRMYSNIVDMDRQVGRILDDLEADGLLDSTIVVWYTDHGGPLPRQKRALQDSGIRVPMIIRFPNGAHAGAIDDRLLSFVDLKPTTMSLAGIEPPGDLDGRAFLGPYASKEARTHIHAAADRFDAEPDGVRAVRDRRFKYLRHLRPGTPCFVPVTYREGQPIMRELLRLRDEEALTPEQALWFCAERPAEQLFDTESDPHEVSDLAGNPAYAGKLEELRTEADRWLTSLGPWDRMNEDSLVSILRPGGTQPKTQDPTIRIENGLLTIASPTPGASIGVQVLTDGDPPGRSWSVYVSPIPIAGGAVVRAVAHRLGYLSSAIVEWNTGLPASADP